MKLLLVAILVSVSAFCADPIEFRLKSLDGGQREDLVVKASKILSVGEYTGVSEKAQILAILLKRFPLGTTKETLCRELRKCRRSNLRDTELIETSEGFQNQRRMPATIKFEIRSYVRLFVVEGGREREEEDSMSISTITFEFALSTDEKVAAVDCWQGSRPL